MDQKYFCVIPWQWDQLSPCFLTIYAQKVFPVILFTSSFQIDFFWLLTVSVLFNCK